MKCLRNPAGAIIRSDFGLLAAIFWKDGPIGVKFTHVEEKAMLKKISNKLVEAPYIGKPLLFVKALATRFRRDRITVEASHLAYVTLLSLVPLLTVLFSMLSALPMFGAFKEQMKKFIFDNFVPSSGDVLAENLSTFSNNASNTTIIGSIFLLVTAMMLIGAIDSSINQIWKCDSKRPAIMTFSVYWMVLSMGPLLFGCSLALTSYVVSLKIDDGIGFVAFCQRNIIRFSPIIFSFGALLLTYAAVPMRKINVRYAAIGALTAAILLELGKQLFSLYIIYFPSYHNIYGAIAVVPILLVWIYVSWLIIFIGVEIQASLQDVRDISKSEKKGGVAMTHQEELKLLEERLLGKRGALKSMAEAVKMGVNRAAAAAETSKISELRDSSAGDPHADQKIHRETFADGASEGSKESSAKEHFGEAFRRHRKRRK